jgi:hypothetical protein
MTGGGTEISKRSMKMKKAKLIALFALTMPLAAVATEQKINPLPKNGIHVVPLSSMDIPEAYKNEVIANAKEQREKGYVEKESQYGQFLLSLPKRAEQEIKSFKVSNNPGDSHLKADFSQIKLAFPFNGLSSINKKDVIGYAPIGGWNNGWTGIKVFFKQNKSICSYSYFDFAASHGAAQLNEESASKDINGKTTYIDVEGNYNTGFLYGVTWFGENSMHKMECANMMYDKSLTNKTINLAQHVDKEISS